MHLSDEMAVDFRGKLAGWQAPEEERLVAALGIKVERREVAGVPVVVLTPRELRHAGVVALAVHGGGFTLGTARDAMTLLVAAELGVATWSVDYALAPEARAPVALEQVAVVYRELVAQTAPSQVVAFGHSAGANVLLAALHRAHSDGLPMPRAVALLSPLVDLSGVGDSFSANAGRDVLGVNVGREGVRKYLPREAEGDLKAPQVSPLYAEYGTWFPRTLITVGTRDLLLSDAVRLSWKLREAAVPVELIVNEGLWHGAEANEAVPEAARLRRSVAWFLAAREG
jgi:acetyl esterase/lipase